MSSGAAQTVDKLNTKIHSFITQALNAIPFQTIL